MKCIGSWTLAAKRGVDVRIITPGIPDKKMIYSVTRSYYDGLASSGVHVFEYKPGFLHAKQCISDDDVATIGTINLDYRSLYLHFENAVFLYGSPCIKDMKADFMETFSDFQRCYRAVLLRQVTCFTLTVQFDAFDCSIAVTKTYRIGSGDSRSDTVCFYSHMLASFKQLQLLL